MTEEREKEEEREQQRKKERKKKEMDKQSRLEMREKALRKTEGNGRMASLDKRCPEINKSRQGENQKECEIGKREWQEKAKSVCGGDVKAGKMTGKKNQEKATSKRGKRQTGPRATLWVCLILLRKEFGGVVKISSNPHPHWLLKGCSLHSREVDKGLEVPTGGQ